MNDYFDSIALMLIGAFGVIAGIINKGFYLGGWWYGNVSNETKRIYSIFCGVLIFIIGFGLFWKNNHH